MISFSVKYIKKNLKRFQPSGLAQGLYQSHIFNTLSRLILPTAVNIGVEESILIN